MCYSIFILHIICYENLKLKSNSTFHLHVQIFIFTFAKRPTAIIPQAPPNPCTQVAPTASSTYRLILINKSVKLQVSRDQSINKSNNKPTGSNQSIKSINLYVQINQTTGANQLINKSNNLEALIDQSINQSTGFNQPTGSNQ